MLLHQIQRSTDVCKVEVPQLFNRQGLKMSDVDFEGLSKYSCKSVRQLRRTENDNPVKFEIMVNEYERHLSEKIKTGSERENVILASILKGGTGKSTAADFLAYYLGNTLIINIDFTQAAEEINSCDTIEYIDYIEDYSLTELVDLKLKEYDYIIIDTPSDNTQELHEAYSIVNKIIMPMTIGKRSREGAHSTLTTFFGKGTDLKGNFKIFFMFNAYTNKAKRKEAIANFVKMYNSLEFDENIKIKSKLGALDYSDTIYTAEERGAAVMSLIEENRGAYQKAALKISEICSQIEKHLEL